MKLFSYGKDGGKDSTVSGFWFIEIKSLFSIVLLFFEKGSREAYHNHSFNAISWFLKGNVDEYHLDGTVKNWKASLKPKLTLRSCFHKVFANEKTYCLSTRGPWVKTWNEYLPKTKKFTTLTNGRKLVNE